VSYGQLFATTNKALQIREIAKKNEIMANQLLPLLDSMLSVYQLNIVEIIQRSIKSMCNGGFSSLVCARVFLPNFTYI